VSAYAGRNAEEKNRKEKQEEKKQTNAPIFHPV